MKILALTFILCTFLLPVQANEIPSVSLIPKEKMQQLSMLEGRWNMTVFVTEDDGLHWKETPEQSVSLGFRHKGMVLEESPLDLMSPGFHMLTMISYDQYRKVYRKAAFDDVWGIMDLYEGNIENGQLIMTNLKSKTFFPVAESVWRAFRLTIELKDVERYLWVEKSDDGGLSWQQAFKVRYREI